MIFSPLTLESFVYGLILNRLESSLVFDTNLDIAFLLKSLLILFAFILSSMYLESFEDDLSAAFFALLYLTFESKYSVCDLMLPLNVSATFFIWSYYIRLVLELWFIIVSNYLPLVSAVFKTITRFHFLSVFAVWYWC